jgi:hypothetical protein
MDTDLESHKILLQKSQKYKWREHKIHTTWNLSNFKFSQQYIRRHNSEEYKNGSSIALVLQHQTVGHFVNEELGKTWREAVMAYFKVPSQNLYGETEKN